MREPSVSEYEPLFIEIQACFSSQYLQLNLQRFYINAKRLERDLSDLKYRGFVGKYYKFSCNGHQRSMNTDAGTELARQNTRSPWWTFPVSANIPEVLPPSVPRQHYTLKIFENPTQLKYRRCTMQVKAATFTFEFHHT